MCKPGPITRSLTALTFVCSLCVPARSSLAQDFLHGRFAEAGDKLRQPNSEPLSAATEAVSLPDDPILARANATQASTVVARPDQQTKRILFIIPNFRSVSADVTLPPLSPKEKLKLALADTFDYSSFIFVGITAGVAQAGKSYPEFHQGAVGYGRYYWHGLADSIGSNSFTEVIVPIATHEDPRYYTLGHGGFLKRTVYAFSRLAIAKGDDGNATPNLSEIVGAGAGAGVSNFYYPGKDRTWTKTGQKWATQVGLDGISNIAKEFWPEINRRAFNRRF